MLFKKKSSPLPHLKLFSGDQLLYEGALKDLPLKESVIIEKSIFFFNDPEPCYIHRGAVQVRLTEELRREMVSLEKESPGPLLLSWADFEGITSCCLS